jgi:hypothetical protein
MTNVTVALARYMPPTSPIAPGFPCISVVFTRTFVNGEDHGVKPFVLQLHDGHSMTPGVKIKSVTVKSASISLANNWLFTLGLYLHAAAHDLSTTL